MKPIIILLLVTLIFPTTLACAKDIKLPRENIVAAKIVDLETGEVVFEHNSDVALNPASTLKNFTFYEALTQLGQAYTYKTSAYIQGRDLYFQFTGAPDLTLEQLDGMIADIATQHGSKFHNIYISPEKFGESYYSNGVTQDSTKFCYAAPVSTFSLDKNCIRLHQVKHESLTYAADNLFNPIHITATAKKISDENCDLDLISLGDNKYKLAGCYNHKNIPIHLKIAASEPKKFAHQAVAMLLKKNGVSYNAIYEGGIKGNTKPVHVIESAPVSALAANMLHNSDNYIADTFIKTLASRNYHQSLTPGLIEKYLDEQIRQNYSDYCGFITLHDGSGLSRTNYVSAGFMSKVLEKIYKQPEIFAQYKNAAPRPGGETGTLKKSFLNSSFKDKIFAKTGSLNYARALAGFVEGENAKHYSFVIFVNNHVMPGLSAKIYEELILDEFF